MPDVVNGKLECHCIPGHRSNHVTHSCEDCGYTDAEMEDGKPVPPCTRLQEEPDQ